MGSVHPGRRPPMSGGKLAAVIAVSVVGGLLLMIGIWYGVYRLTGSGRDETAPSGQETAAALCSALTADPTGDRYSLATRLIPPDRDLGLVGNAQSYRQAARLIDGFCPSNYDQAELLRGMARTYDPSGG